MRAKMNGEAGGRLREAKRKFDRWRRECCGPGRIPTELWQLAAQATAEHGIAETAYHLQLNPQRLEQWVNQLGLGRGATEAGGAEFVELAALALSPPGECQVEVEELSGRKLRIWLTGSAVAHLASVAAVLCGKEVAP
jgi:transposase-like protein